jgi:hypothetical protein
MKNGHWLSGGNIDESMTIASRCTEVLTMAQEACHTRSSPQREALLTPVSSMYSRCANQRSEISSRPSLDYFFELRAKHIHLSAHQIAAKRDV